MSPSSELKVLLAVDGSVHAEAASALVQRLPWPVSTVIHVLAVAVPPWTPYALHALAQRQFRDYFNRAQQAQRETAATLAKRTADCLAGHSLQVTAATAEGNPSKAILERVAELGTDLLIIGARGLGGSTEFHLGSTAHKLARRAPCSVLVVRPLLHPALLSVVLAADASPASRHAADFICRLGLPRWASVTVVSVAEASLELSGGAASPYANAPAEVLQALLDAAEWRAAQVAEHLQTCPAQVRKTVRLGGPAAELVATAREQDCDLMVLGAHEPAPGAEPSLDTVPDKVLRYAPCSVLLVR
jgi:nucleotide-binding universal stress UspA family protein